MDSVSAFNKSDVTVAKSSPVREPITAMKNDKLQRNASPRNSGRKRELPKIPTKVR